jgi:hypothetical protein
MKARGTCTTVAITVANTMAVHSPCPGCISRLCARSWSKVGIWTQGVKGYTKSLKSPMTRCSNDRGRTASRGLMGWTNVGDMAGWFVGSGLSRLERFGHDGARRFSGEDVYVGNTTEARRLLTSPRVFDRSLYTGSENSFLALSGSGYAP